MPYADSNHCPDCRTALAGHAQQCPTCGLLLTGPVATELFRTLRTADELLARLRALAPVAAPRPTTVPRPTTAGLTPYPVPTAHPAPLADAPATSGRSGMLESGVPKLLLGLGAACLLVGSLVFLAIAWVLMGVGGRTAVLAGLTAAAAVGTYVAARRPLSAAAESFGAVTAGMVLLVLGGASAAGWLDALGADGVITAMGASLIGLGVGGTVGMRTTPLKRLVSGEIAAVLGAVLVSVGVMLAAESVAAGCAVGTLLLLGLALVGHALDHRPLTVAAAVTAALTWSGLVVAGLARAEADASFAALWLGFDVWPLLAATTLAAAPIFVTTLRRGVRLVLAAAAGAAGVTALVIALHGINLDAAVIGWTLALLGVCAASHLLTTWRPALLGPAIAAAAVPLVALVDALHLALANVSTIRHPAGADVRIDAASGLLDQPWVALVAALGIAVAVATGLAQHVPAARGDRGGVLLLLLSGVAVTAAYPVPLALVVAELALIGSFLVALAVVRSATSLTRTAWFSGLAALVLAAASSAPSEALTVIAFLPLIAGLALAMTAGRRDELLSTLAESAAPIAVALWLVKFGAVLDLPAEPTRAFVVLVLGLLVALPGRLALAIASTVAAVLLTAAVGSGAHPADWLAVHLTIAGVSAGAAALLHREWRHLSWAGGALLVLASWVRLVDARVSTPEAYTLPAALALLAVGVVVLLRDPARTTAGTLVSGLVLALAPSTLLAFAEPATLRGLLVGLAALALVLAGAALRWSAPLVAGAIVGALLLLRALAPYAADLPPYVVILAAGAVLVTVGVTWESRLASLRRTQSYIARLR